MLEAGRGEKTDFWQDKTSEFAQAGERFATNIGGENLEEIMAKARKFCGNEVEIRLDTSSVVDGRGRVFGGEDFAREIGAAEKLYAAVYVKEKTKPDTTASSM